MLSQTGMGECPLPRLSIPQGTSHDRAGLGGGVCFSGTASKAEIASPLMSLD